VFGEIVEVRILFLAGLFIISDVKFAGEGCMRLGFAKVAGAKASLEFKLPLLPTLLVAYEVFGGFCLASNCG
jgi:hypothetical protein